MWQTNQHDDCDCQMDDDDDDCLFEIDSRRLSLSEMARLSFGQVTEYNLLAR